MRFLAIRHGTTSHNKRKIIQSQTIRGVLTAEAKEETKKLAQTLPEMIDVIYTSDLLRTRQTAEIINAYHAAELVVSTKLREVNLGILAGRTWTDIREEYGSEFVLNYMRQDYDFRPLGGESVHDVRERVLSFLNDMKGTLPLLVTHGGIIRFLKHHFMKETDERTPNLSVHEFEM